MKLLIGVPIEEVKGKTSFPPTDLRDEEQILEGGGRRSYKDNTPA